MPKNPRRPIWTPKADQDLIEIWHYIAVEASGERADDIITRIVGVADRIGMLPFSGRPRDDIRLGIRCALTHPYIIFYRIVENEAQILAVLHQSRNLAAAMAKRD